MKYSHLSTSKYFSSFAHQGLLRRTSLRFLKYDPYANLKKWGGAGAHSRENLSSDGVRINIGNMKPSSEEKTWETHFKTTLPSGRFAEDEVIEKARERRSVAAEGNGPPRDQRFFRPVSDYREVQDGDPYAPLFGESARVEKVRLKTWQRQFEEENKNVWLPYERTSRLRKTVPNWFIRTMVQARDKGGFKPTLWAPLLVLCFLLGSYLLFFVIRRPGTKVHEYKPIDEAR